VLTGTLSSGGGGGNDKSASSGASKQAKSQKKPSKSKGQSGSGSATPAPAAAAPSTGAADQSTPGGVVASFYKTSIDDPHAAWMMGTDNLHSQLQSEQSFAAQESTLKSIDFPQLTVTNQTGNSATVQFSSVARHTTKTDRCQGSISVVKGTNGWLVDHLDTVNCTHAPPS
jgi:hypothetical protein